jgi:hypothetical protein
METAAVLLLAVLAEVIVAVQLAVVKVTRTVTVTDQALRALH